MAAVNPQPLQAFPYECHVPSILPCVGKYGDDGGEYEDGFDDNDDDDDDAMDEVEDDHVTSGDASGAAAEQYYHNSSGVSRCNDGIVMGSRTSELTLAFEGEVYVFPAVTPEKVHAVLLLLGGPETPTGVPSVDVPFYHNNRVVNEIPKYSNISRRIASLVRFREKRKERCFDKKIRYTIRKEVAQRMHRKNGQFASVKEGSGPSSWDAGKGVPQGNNAQCPETVPSLRKCQHCGVSESSTPAMRRGPAGPRTLCNACGLMWANKGTLRDLSKGGRNHSLDKIEPGTTIHIKPSILEGQHVSSNQDEATSEDPSKAEIAGLNNKSINPDIEDFGTAGDFTNSLPLDIISSSGNLDDQETLIDFANAPETEMDIPTKFD